MRAKTIITTILFFVGALSVQAQNVGTFSNDFNFEHFQAGDEEPFVLYTGHGDFLSVELCEASSLMWTVTNGYIRQYNLKRARMTDVTIQDIPISFQPYTKEGMKCSPSGKYFAVLEESTPARLHIFNSGTGTESANVLLPIKFSTTSQSTVCRISFISETEVAVAIPKKVLIYDIATGEQKVRGHKLSAVQGVSTRGNISGYVTKKKKYVNMVYNIGNKKYWEGCEQEEWNFLRVYDKGDNYSRYYIRKINGKRSLTRTDMFNEYGISSNRIFPVKKGSEALVFPNHTILGWMCEEELLVVISNNHNNLMVLNYAVIGTELEKQYIRAALRDKNLAKLQNHLKNNPHSLYKEMTLKGLVNMFKQDNGSRFRYSDIANTFKSFPEKKRVVEPLLADYVTNNEEAIYFLDEYPKSRYLTKVMGNAFRSRQLDLLEVQELRSNFGSAFFLTRFDPITTADNKTRQNYLESLYAYEHPKGLKAMEEFYSTYQWLAYAEKGKDLAGHLWDILVADPKMDGGYIIYIIRNVAQNPTYRSWGCTQQLAENLLREKLAAEISNVQILSRNIVDSGSDEWSRWVKSKYTAGIVAQEGEKKVVIYGEIRNNSRFPLPIIVNAYGNLMCQFDVKGGLIGGLFNIGKALGVVRNDPKCVANRSASFQIPTLSAKKTTAYAVMLDFGNVKNFGVNLADRVKFTKASYVDGVSVNLGIGNYHVDESTLRKQDEWQKFAKNGLPRVELTDFWRGEKVDEEEWSLKWQKHQEEMRIAAENAELERRRKKIAYDILDDLYGH